MLRNLGALHELDGQLLVVKGEGEDGAGGSPCPNHEVMNRHGFGVEGRVVSSSSQWDEGNGVKNAQPYTYFPPPSLSTADQLQG